MALPGVRLSMSSNTARIVQASFAELAPLAPAAGRIFYRELFLLDPSLRTLFVGNLERQGEKLMQMIGAAVNLADQPQKLLPVLRQLGARRLDQVLPPGGDHHDGGGG